MKLFGEVSKLTLYLMHRRRIFTKTHLDDGCYPNRYADLEYIIAHPLTKDMEPNFYNLQRDGFLHGTIGSDQMFWPEASPLLLPF